MHSTTRITVVFRLHNLQIVCDALYTAATSDNVPGDSARIMPQQFAELGGVEAILGHYLIGVVDSFPEEQRATVRVLLGALVSTTGVKQRVTLDDVAWMTNLESTDVAVLLDALAQKRLLQRYTTPQDRVAGSHTGHEGVVEHAGGLQVSYELTHDYLVAEIVRWLGEDFWARQKAREIVRQALPEWQGRTRVLPADDLQLIAAQWGHLRFTADEVEMIYAASVVHVAHSVAPPAAWREQLPEAEQRRVLKRLLQHVDDAVREQAARAVGAKDDASLAAALAERILSDDAEDVRRAAAHSLAVMADRKLDVVCASIGQLGAAARAAKTSADGRARQALVEIRDQAPVSAACIPPQLRGAVGRRVRTVRWRRHWPDTLEATTRGALGGMLGLGLGLGIALGLGARELFGSATPDLRYSAALLLFGFAIGGLLGLISGGATAFAGAVVSALSDRKNDFRDWAVMTATCALCFGVLLGAVSSVVPGQSNWVSSFLAGLLLGTAFVGVAVAPFKQPMLVRLGIAAFVGLSAVIVLQVTNGFLQNLSFALLLQIGIFGSIGFTRGLGPMNRYRARAATE